MGKLTDKARAASEPSALLAHDREVNKWKTKADILQAQLRQVEAERESLEKMAEFRGALAADVGTLKRRPFVMRKPRGEATAVVCINDLHCEERVDSATINGLNEYALPICEKRLQVVGDRFLKLLTAQRTISNIRDMVVWIGGDVVSGHIHEELVEGNACSPLDACAWARKRLMALLDHWLEYSDVDSLTVVTSYGNHGRTTPKPRIATAAGHSFEFAMYEVLAALYEARGERRIQFKIERGYHNWLDVQGKQVRFHHGDWIKYAGGVGGITIPVNKAIAQWNKSRVADFDFFGHWHQFDRSRRWCACNCLIGYGPYAESIKAEFSEPSQTFAVFDSSWPVPVTVQEIFCT